jgi:DNA-3-methyladenine glycosylase I
MAKSQKPVVRCGWAETHDLHQAYHDAEWGVPSHDDRLLFEMICLEGAQAGLSWLTILQKRDGYRRAFENFDINRIVDRVDDARQAELLLDPAIVRHRQKIAAVVKNARAAQAVRDEFGSLDTYIWAFVGDRPIVDGRANGGVEISVTLSKDLKKRGFGFVGPTTMYAFMQAVGLVNDHEPQCFRLADLATSK